MHTRSAILFFITFKPSNLVEEKKLSINFFAIDSSGNAFSPFYEIVIDQNCDTTFFFRQSQNYFRVSRLFDKKKGYDRAIFVKQLSDNVRFIRDERW